MTLETKLCKVQVSYDKEADIAQIIFSGGSLLEFSHTKYVDNDPLIGYDFDKNDRLIGIRVINPIKNLPEYFLEQFTNKHY